MDRDELKAAAKEFYASWMADETNEGSTWGTASVLADFALEQIEALRDKTRWIPVEERLPEDLGWYLVSIQKTTDLGTFSYSDILSFGHDAHLGRRWFTGTDRVTVIAWAERPEPYKP